MRVPDGSVLLTGRECASLDPRRLRELCNAEARRNGLSSATPGVLELLAELEDAASRYMARRAAEAVTAMTGSGDPSEQPLGHAGHASGAGGSNMPEMTAGQVASTLGLQERQVRRLREQRVIVGRKIGRGYLYDAVSVADEAGRRAAR
ncbi:MAG: hypothetical protein QOD92_3928 [Acidimicrobiaceae bacterium]|jgi:hypothetical protein